jgi:hypothetical protein
VFREHETGGSNPLTPTMDYAVKAERDMEAARTLEQLQEDGVIKDIKYIHDEILISGNFEDTDLQEVEAALRQAAGNRVDVKIDWQVSF